MKSFRYGNSHIARARDFQSYYVCRFINGLLRFCAVFAKCILRVSVIMSERTVTIDDVKKHLTQDECTALDAALKAEATDSSGPDRSLSFWLAGALDWSDSPQGHGYWSEICARLSDVDRRNGMESWDGLDAPALGPKPAPDIGDSRPAFPTDICDGMTLRDYFAAKAMQGICDRWSDQKLTAQQIAGHAYYMADAMLAARGGV